MKDEAISKAKEHAIWALLRISLGLIFLWAFLDKLLGLGFTTAADKSWLVGNSPTTGFLKAATRGPFAAVYQSMAGSVIVDWLFMIGLLLIGTALIVGIGVKIASYSGALLLLLMWSAALPPEHHPFLDEHIIYAIVLVGIANANAGDYWGLGAWWRKHKLIENNEFLR